MTERERLLDERQPVAIAYRKLASVSEGDSLLPASRSQHRGFVAT